MSTDQYEPHNIKIDYHMDIPCENKTTKKINKESDNNLDSETKNYELDKNEKFHSDLELTERLKAASSFRVHLSNVICGINHEVSPWLGSISNIVERLKKHIEKGPGQKTEEERKAYCLSKLDKIVEASENASNLLSMLSGSVKQLQIYSNVNSPVVETVNSWIKLVLADRIFKNLISENNIIIDELSLDFFAEHSPMLLSQIILNLAKNSVEHNEDMLEDLKIEIYGDASKKYLIFEDNGKGISPDILNRVFSPGITSKNITDSQTHGFGLSACMDYCIAMGASIWAKSEPNKYTRFVIKFEKTYEDENSKNLLKQQVNESGFIDLNAVSSALNVYNEKIERQKEKELW
jgi:signal transduction histidine kinase